MTIYDIPFEYIFYKHGWIYICADMHRCFWFQPFVVSSGIRGLFGWSRNSIFTVSLNFTYCWSMPTFIVIHSFLLRISKGQLYGCNGDIRGISWRTSIFKHTMGLAAFPFFMLMVVVKKVWECGCGWTVHKYTVPDLLIRFSLLGINSLASKCSCTSILVGWCSKYGMWHWLVLTLSVKLFCVWSAVRVLVTLYPRCLCAGSSLSPPMPIIHDVTCQGYVR